MATAGEPWKLRRGYFQFPKWPPPGNPEKLPRLKRQGGGRPLPTAYVTLTEEAPYLQSQMVMQGQPSVRVEIPKAPGKEF